MRSLSPLQSQARELSYRKAAVLVLLQASLPSFVRPTTLNTINNSICFPYFSYYVRTLPHLVISSHLNCKWLPRRRTKPIIAEIVSSSSPNKNHPAVLLRPPNLLASWAASLTLSTSELISDVIWLLEHLRLRSVWLCVFSVEVRNGHHEHIYY